jgi:hypothetical protein
LTSFAFNSLTGVSIGAFLLLLAYEEVKASIAAVDLRAAGKNSKELTGVYIEKTIDFE